MTHLPRRLDSCLRLLTVSVSLENTRAVAPAGARVAVREEPDAGSAHLHPGVVAETYWWTRAFRPPNRSVANDQPQSSSTEKEHHT